MGKAVMNVDEFEVSTETKKDLQLSFTPYFEQAQALQDKALAIEVTAEDQVEAMSEAREMRLELKTIRVDTEKKRKEMKAESLLKGKAIDGFANIIKFLIVPIEEHLQNQEDFVKRIEEGRLDDLEEKRRDILEGYEDGISEEYNLREMEETTFEMLVKTYEREKQEKIEAEKKEEADRIQREKEEAEENERIRKENAKLQKEADERDKKEAAKQAERDKEDADRKAEQKKIDDAHEAELEKERAKQEKLEKELQDKKDADALAKRKQEEKEQKEKAAKEKADKEAALAPDKKKLEAFAIEIGNITFPEVKSKEAVKVLKEANSMIHDVSEFIKDSCVEL